MYYVPYFKSKRHIIIFIIFLALIFISIALFTAGLIASLVSKEPELKNDPIVTGFIIAFIISTFISIAACVVFIVDLVLFFIARRKAKITKQ